jgi:hypothetical protein
VKAIFIFPLTTTILPFGTSLWLRDFGREPRRSRAAFRRPACDQSQLLQLCLAP